MHAPRWIQLTLGAAVIAASVGGCSKSAQDYVTRGDAQLQKGNVNAAVLEYRNAVQKDGMFAPARLKLADAYVRQGNGSGALAESVRAADLLPNDADAQLKAGALLLVAGRAQDALGRADKALAIKPKRADALLLRANALAGLTDLDGAIEQIQQAIALQPTADSQASLGFFEAAKGRLPEAEAAFRQAIATDSKSVTAHLALARFLAGTGRAAEAEGEFKAALAIDAGNLLANRYMAAFCIAFSRAAEAEPYLKKVADTSKDPNATVALADYYVWMRRYADALAVLEKLSATPRAWAVAKSRAAAVLYADGKPSDAYRTIDEVVAKQPAYSEARVIRARFLLAEGKADQAFAEAQEAVKSEPRNAGAHYLLGSIQREKQNLAGAAASFNEVLRLNPRATAVQVQLAAIELQRGEFASATQLAEQALQRAPRSLEAKLILAGSLIARGDVDRATTVTRELVEAFPQAGAAHAQAGLLAMRKGDRAGARAAYEKALALDAALLEPLAALAALDVADGKGAKARARVEARLQKAPRDSAVLVVAARTWAGTGDWAKAEEFLRRAIDADASNLDAYSLLGQLFLSQNRLGEALTQFDTLAARQPGAVGPQTMAGLILEAQGKPDEARKRYERLVETDPRAAVASNNLAWMYASRGEQLDRALQLAQAAKAELPENSAVNDTLGYVYIKKQLPSLAIPALRLAVSKEPGNPAFYYHLGLAYSQLGDKAAARQALEQALKLKADFDGAEDARKLLSTLG